MSNRRKLTPRKLAFLSAYFSGKNGAESAISAGYSANNARHRSYQLLNEDPLVMEAVRDHREKLLNEANYSSEIALRELDQQIAKATDAKQYSAVARLIELKMKACGLLSEKKDTPQSSLTLNIVGVDMAKSVATEPPTIEATTSEIFN
jgi:hypothetical protein